MDRHKLTVFYLKSFDMDSVQVGEAVFGKEIPILPSLSTLSKKPMIAMSLSATKAFASSTVASVLAAGPVFFSSQETIVSAVRPGNKD